MSDLWENLLAGHTASNHETTVDAHLSRSQLTAASLVDLTERGRASNALKLPVSEGTRVAFKGTLGAVLSMTDPPARGDTGEVVAVRSGKTYITSHDGMVFVKWSDGRFRPTHAEFLMMAPQGRTGSHRLRVASLGDLSGFLKTSSGRLVQKSTRDLWSIHKDGDGGGFVVERLFSGDGKPLKG